jgi:hypothetical protein
MPQFGGKNAKKTSSTTKRHFTVVMGGKEHGLYVSSTPSSAAKKAVTKLCAANKSKKVEFHIREITQDSKKKTYGPYEGHIEKLKEPIELKGRVIKYKPVAKLSGKTGAKKGGMRGGDTKYIIDRSMPFEIEIILKDSSNAHKIDMLSLIKPFLDEELIQEDSILVNNKIIQFKWDDKLDMYDIIKKLFQKKYSDIVFKLLESIGNYKINFRIPSISNDNGTKSLREYMWFEKSQTGNKILSKALYQINYDETKS